MRTLALISGKGGTGKTTTAYEFAHFASRKAHVLAIDLDSQSSLTACFLASAPAHNIADVMAGIQSLPVVVEKASPLLDLLPAGIELASVELQLAGRLSRELVLRRALQTARYDICIIDTPPALGLLTANALAAADVAVIVAQPEAMNLHSIQNAIDAVEAVKAEVNPGLELAGILITQYAGYLNHHAEALGAMRATKLPLLRTLIPRTIRAADIAVTRRPIEGPAAEAYESAWKEIEKWLRK